MIPTTEWADVPTIPRDRWTRPLVIPPSGGKAIAYTRCTTFVGALEDTYNLGQWQQRMVARGLAVRGDLLARVASLGPQPEDDEKAKGWKATLNALVDDAREAAAASSAANIGTALHEFTEAYDTGRLDLSTVPAMYRPHMDAYARATDKLRAVEVERFLVQDDLKIGGTTDRILRVEGREDLGLVIGDVKTGSIEYGASKMAMQLAVYARSERYHPSGMRSAIDEINLSRGLIIHLDAKTAECSLHWVNLMDAWEAVQLAASVRAWRARKDLMARADDLDSPALPVAGVPVTDFVASTRAQTAEAAVLVAIESANSRDDLEALYYATSEPTSPIAWTDAMTAASKARLATLTAPAA